MFDLLLLGCKVQPNTQVAYSFPGNLKHWGHVALSERAEPHDLQNITALFEVQRLRAGVVCQ